MRWRPLHAAKERAPRADLEGMRKPTPSRTRRRTFTRTRFATFALAAGLACFAIGLDADALPRNRPLSQYEQERIAAALAYLGKDLQLEPEPEGKIVEAIEIVPLDVFEDRDLFSVALGKTLTGFLNSLHVTTRKSVVRREVLLKIGQPYDQQRAEETERNVRAFVPISAVLLVPFKGSRADRVQIVVITKDLWSLRLNSDFEFVNDKLTYFSAQPQEANLLGTASVANLNLVLTPDTITTGIGYTDPRFAGRGMILSSGVNAILDCEERELEGGSGFFYYGQPLYTTRTEWSWLTYVTYANSVVRIGNGLEPRSICSDGVDSIAVPNLVVADPDDPSQPLRRAVPRRNPLGEVPLYLVGYPQLRNEYRSETLRGQVAITRSFGVLHKYNLGFGAEARRFDGYTDGFPEQRLPAFDLANNRPTTPGAQFERAFLARGGASEVRINPYVQLRAFTNHFLRLINVETLGLAEDYRLGHDLRLRLSPALRAFGSSNNVLGLFASAGYTWPVRRGYLEALLAWDAEYAAFSPYGAPARNRADATFTAATRFVTPDLGFGRFVTNFDYQRRATRYLRGALAIDRTSGLRGYRLCATGVIGTELQTGTTATDCFIGEQRVLLNLELRSRPLLLLSTLWGVALFYDAGDAFNELRKPPPGSRSETGLTSFRPRSSVGAGLRILIPQADRQVLRLDFAAPLNRDDPRSEFTFIATYGQAFGAPFAAPDVLLQ